MKPFELHVVDGTETGKSWRFGEGDAFSIGRGAGNDVVLDDDHVSRSHARVECARGEVVVRDLGSTGGVHVNGIRVTQARLTPGDSVQVGRQLLVLIATTGETRQVPPTDDTTEIAAVPRASRERITKTSDACSGRLAVGPYRVIERLAEGGLGTVFVAVREGTCERVALKILRPGPDADPECRERFDREIRISEGLVHPHIVRSIDSGRDGQAHYLVTELVDGPSVSAILQEGERIAVDRALRWGTEIASALVYAHGRNVIHRDLKPGNVVVERATDRSRVLDFGLGLALDQSDTRLTFTGQTLGTVQYAPPEQVEDAKRVDARSDVYGLGAVLYAMLTGLPPFASRSRFRLMESVLHEPPRPVLELRPDAPPDLAAIVERALRKQPAERFQSAREILDALAGARG